MARRGGPITLRLFGLGQPSRCAWTGRKKLANGVRYFAGERLTGGLAGITVIEIHTGLMIPGPTYVVEGRRERWLP